MASARVAAVIVLRVMAYYAGFGVWTIVLGVIGLPCLLLGRRAVVRLSEIWTGGTLAWLGLTVGLTHEVRGMEHRPAGAAIVALKHQSAWDTLILNRLLNDPAIVYKRELIWLPIIGLFIRAAGMIPIDRKAGATALRRLIADAGEAARQGRPIVIFPEGTRGPVGGKLPYQPGVGALYTQLELPLVPVALNSGIFWGRQALLKRPGRIVIEFLPPIAPGADRRRAMALLEERIETASARLTAEALG